MSKELKIEDFEVVADPNSAEGCEKCFFQGFEIGCKVVDLKVGIELEKKYGSCLDESEHYYKLKNEE